MGRCYEEAVVMETNRRTDALVEKPYNADVPEEGLLQREVQETGGEW